MPKLKLNPKKKPESQEQPQDEPDPPVNRPATRKSLRGQSTVPDPVPTPRVGRPRSQAAVSAVPPTSDAPTPRVGRPRTQAATPAVPPTPDPESTPRVGRPRSKKTAPPPTPQPQTTNKNITLHNVSPNTARTLSTRTPVVSIQRCGPRTRNSLAREPQEPVQNEQPPPPRRKKRVRRDPQPQNETIEDDPPTRDRHNILLPSPDSFPTQNDNNLVTINKLKELRESVKTIFCLVMDQIQGDEDNLQPCYESIEKVYEYFDKVVGRGWGDEERVAFGGKYRNVCVHALYSFGAVVWKQNIGKGATCNPFATSVAKFLEYCFMHLGWKAERGRAGMKEWKDSSYAPAAYYVVKMFYKYNSDRDSLTRQHQLSLINKLLESAHKSDNNAFIEFVWETIGKVIMIRVKDKSAQCRVLSLKILSFFVGIDEATGVCQKELKYYTRYDPFVEVRRLGTKILGEKTRMKMRFFFDQAFDKNEGVRVEAFRALGVEDGGEGLVRDMEGLSSERLCKVIVWGAMHSGPKIREIIKSEILPKWMKISCKSDLVKFLLNIDAYQHMKAVVRILDMLLTTEEQEQFVESIDLSFVETLKKTVTEKRYKDLSIESFVAWLGLCKASKEVASIREKVVPSSEELLGLIAGLHEGVFVEHEDAKEVGRNEDITPVFCLVIGLEVGRGFVHWEEGGRRELVRSLKEILLDPLLDERVVVIQAINTLHSFVDEVEFEDIMMNVFQEVFDSRSGFNRTVVGEEEMGGEEVVEDVVDEVEVEEVEPERVPLTAMQLARMKEKVCEVAMKRVNLQKQKDELLKRKMFIDAAPVSNEIGQLQTEEAGLKEKMREEEEYAREWVANAARRERELERVVEVAQDDGIGMEEESEVGRRGGNKSGVISSVEEGLSKGMFMINAFLDLCPKMGGFVRGLYDAHIPGFMIEKDVTIRMSVLQFLTRIAMIDKGELRKVFCFLVNVLLGDSEVELKNVSFQCLVDLVVCFEFCELCLQDNEVFEGEAVHPFLGEMTKHLTSIIPELCTDYTDCSPEIMEKFVMELLTVRFPPLTDRMNNTEINILNTSKNVGLLKLVVRGRLRDPVILARILCLWANQDYAGTAVLRDLEHVLKLYDTFEWWGGGGDGVVEEIEGEVEDGVRGGVMMRVLGVAVGEGAIMLCGEGGGGKEWEEVVIKFVGYFLSFLTVDQPLMRTIVQTMLTPISTHPTRSYNSLLVKCACKVPITSRVSATAIIKLINEVFTRINEHPATSSIRVLRRELLGYLAKIKRLFGDDIAVLTDGSGKEVVVGRILTLDDDEDDVLEEEEGGDASFDSERGSSEVENS